MNKHLCKNGYFGEKHDLLPIFFLNNEMANKWWEEISYYVFFP